MRSLLLYHRPAALSSLFAFFGGCCWLPMVMVMARCGTTHSTPSAKRRYSNSNSSTSSNTVAASTSISRIRAMIRYQDISMYCSTGGGGPQAGRTRIYKQAASVWLRSVKWLCASWSIRSTGVCAANFLAQRTKIELISLSLHAATMH